MVDYSKFIGLKYKCRGRGYDNVDCYGLCILVYKEILDIELPNYLEVDYNDRWYKEGKNCILDNITDDWIKVSKSFKILDLIVLYNGTTVFPNHTALWIGNNKILHIYENTTSHIDRYKGYWESKFYCALRWKNYGKSKI